MLCVMHAVFCTNSTSAPLQCSMAPPVCMDAANIALMGMRAGIVNADLCCCCCCCCCCRDACTAGAHLSASCSNEGKQQQELGQQQGLEQNQAHERTETAAGRHATAERTAVGTETASASATASNTVSGPLRIIAASGAALRRSRNGMNAAAATAPAAPMAAESAAADSAAAASESTDAHTTPCSRHHPPRVQPHSEHVGELGAQQQARLHRRVVALACQVRSLSRVSFRAGNWLELPCAAGKYDAITCFSVSKWVHLNWGDDGLMRLFHKFFR
jgi:Bicoid-interacting protein 3 (Bin3)